MVAVIQGHFDPWHPQLLNKAEAQLDAILEAYSQDFPNRLRFERKSGAHDREAVQDISIQWADRLIGRGRDELKKRVSFAIPETFRRARTSQRQAPATNQAPPRPVRQMPRIKR